MERSFRVAPFALYFGDAITDEDAVEALEPPARAGRLRCTFTPRIEIFIAQAARRGYFTAHQACAGGARDAVDMFLRNGLQCMALANWWVEKTAVERPAA
jgi:hypothetical protein